MGTLELRVPRVREGSFFPGLLEPRKRAERALVATIREAYVQGVSTRRVDDLVKALGLDGISKSQVSRLCEELDAEVERFRTRKLEGTYPYMWVDATFLKVRQEHRVVNMAVVIAAGLNAAPLASLAGVVVYENTWAVPLLAAIDRSRARIIGEGRIAVDDVLAALDSPPPA